MDLVGSLRALQVSRQLFTGAVRDEIGEAHDRREALSNSPGFLG